MRGVVFGIWSPDSKTVYFKAPFAGPLEFLGHPGGRGQADRQSDIKVMEVRPRR